MQCCLQKSASSLCAQRSWASVHLGFVTFDSCIYFFVFQPLASLAPQPRSPQRCGARSEPVLRIARPLIAHWSMSASYLHPPLPVPAYYYCMSTDARDAYVHCKVDDDGYMPFKPRDPSASVDRMPARGPRLAPVRYYPMGSGCGCALVLTVAPPAPWSWGTVVCVAVLGRGRGAVEIS